jgi:hypothetical protein
MGGKNKLEIRSTKSETSTNDQNLNDQNISPSLVGRGLGMGKSRNTQGTGFVLLIPSGDLSRKKEQRGAMF